MSQPIDRKRSIAYTIRAIIIVPDAAGLCPQRRLTLVNARVTGGNSEVNRMR